MQPRTKSMWCLARKLTILPLLHMVCDQLEMQGSPVALQNKDRCSRLALDLGRFASIRDGRNGRVPSTRAVPPSDDGCGVYCPKVCNQFDSYKA